MVPDLLGFINNKKFQSPLPLELRLWPHESFPVQLEPRRMLTKHLDCGLRSVGFLPRWEVRFETLIDKMS